MILRQLLSLPEPERTLRLTGLPASKAFKVYSPKAFPVKFCGKIDRVEKGENLCSTSFALYLLDKYPFLSEAPLDQPAERKSKPNRSSYVAKLVEIEGIGDKGAAEIVKEFPTPEELIEAAKTNRLPEPLLRFRDSFLEM